MDDSPKLILLCASIGIVSTSTLRATYTDHIIELCVQLMDVCIRFSWLHVVWKAFLFGKVLT